MFQTDDWLKIKSQKICPDLQQKLEKNYKYKKWIPSFLKKAFTAIKERFKKHRILVQVNPEKYVAVLGVGSPKKVLGCRVDKKLDIIDGFSTKVNIKKLKKLLDDEAVDVVWEDRKVRALLDNAATTVAAPKVWVHGYEGRGVGIAVLDTGIYSHPDLIYPKNRIIGFKDFVKNRREPYDDNGHGTHCAGDAAGNGYKSGGRYKGLAPKANLIGVKVLDKRGSGYASRIIAGVQWCIENKKRYGINVLSISVGGKAKAPSKKDPLCKAVRKAWEAGIVVCVAAGNEGPGSRTINSPGNEPTVITVGATDDSNTKGTTDDRVAEFSSRGPTKDGHRKPDLVTPGVNIISLRSPGSLFDRSSSKYRVGQHYTSMSGTSMATPVCAGAIALLLERLPRLKPEEVKKALMLTAKKGSGNRNVEGAGLMDIYSAIKLILRSGGI